MTDILFPVKAVYFPFDCLFTTKNAKIMIDWEGKYESTLEPVTNCTVDLLSTLPFKHLTVLMNNCKDNDEEINILHKAHKCKMKKRLKRPNESKDCKMNLKKRKTCNCHLGSRKTRIDELTIDVYKSTKEAMANLISQLEENTKRIEAIISSF